MAPKADVIIKEICQYYQVSHEEIFKTKRGWFNKPRNIAIYLIRMIRTERLTTIAEMFNMNSYCAASTVIQRVGVLRKKDKKIRRDTDALIEKLCKSQLKI
jgi:chromosomal replication initiation ATPase DnaA